MRLGIGTHTHTHTQSQRKLVIFDFVQEQTRCLKTAKEQEKEMAVLQDNLSQARTELKAAGIKNGELKKALDEITLQLKRRVSLAYTKPYHYHHTCVLLTGS